VGVDPGQVHLYAFAGAAAVARAAGDQSAPRSFGVAADGVYPPAEQVPFVQDLDLAAEVRVHASTVVAASGARGTCPDKLVARGWVWANDSGRDEASHIRGKVRGFALRWPLAASGRVGSGTA
jgi:hypothetical protein